MSEDPDAAADSAEIEELCAAENRGASKDRTYLIRLLLLGSGAARLETARRLLKPGRWQAVAHQAFETILDAGNDSIVAGWLGEAIGPTAVAESVAWFVESRLEDEVSVAEIEWLLAQGGSARRHLDSALRSAVDWGNLDLAKWSIGQAREGDIDLRRDNDRLLEVACDSGSVELVRLVWDLYGRFGIDGPDGDGVGSLRHWRNCLELEDACLAGDSARAARLAEAMRREDLPDTERILNKINSLEAAECVVKYMSQESSARIQNMVEKFRWGTTRQAWATAVLRAILTASRR